MQAPTSYAGPRRDEKKSKPTFSQTAQTNTSQDTATVQRLLAKKGNSVYSVHPEDDVIVAIELLNEKKIGAVLVINEKGKLEGILSERDVVRKMTEIPGQVRMQKVKSLMSSKLITCTPSDSLTSVLRKMTEGRFRHMPVLDNGRLTGILTIGDVVHFRLSELEHEAVRLKQIIVG